MRGRGLNSQPLSSISEATVGFTPTKRGMRMHDPLYSIHWHKPEALLRLTWLAGTQVMDDEDFRDTLEVFADSAIRDRDRRLIIDVRQFNHRPSQEILAWRDAATVPK